MTAAGWRACVIGLGEMGAGMAQRLLRRGVRVSVWNHSPDQAAELVTLGAAAAASPAAAAHRAELVLVCPVDSTATREVLLGPGGVLTDGPLPGVLVSTSTVAPEDMTALAAGTPSMLDACLLGSHRHASAGQLRLYVGGRAEVLARVRPMLNLLAQDVVHVGDLGAGMRLKLLMNLIMGVQVQVMAEAVALGASVGLDRQLVLDAISSSGLASPMTGFKARRLASGDYAAPDFRLRLLAKDLNLAVAAARQVGVKLPLAEAAQHTHDTALALGYGDEDCAAIARLVAAANRSDVMINASVRVDGGRADEPFDRHAHVGGQGHVR